ncbi:MAG: ABC transporter permease [Candidatus Tectomicrobia bacterium]|uniref:ABC transporter permease n=1 Tax=Tectimicrobiota bacterium TaxID=2528274 RepID=A0A933LQR3_UNCTE|nr:ABC transporter permease [Candidatus Tectomicrobia bacterium]
MIELFLMAFKIALRALSRNKLRSALTMLGIIIGVSAVVAMVSIGQGANDSIQKQIASIGTNLIMILSGSTTQTGVRTGMGSTPTITVGDAKAIEELTQVIAAVSYTKRQVMQVIYGNQNWSTAVSGVSPDYGVVRDWPIAEGRFFNKQDEDSTAKVTVLGQTVVNNLFGEGVNPVGEIIRIKNVPFRVVGIFVPKGQTSFGQDQDDGVFVPFSSAEKLLIGSKFLGSVGIIMVSAVSKEAIPEAQKQIKELLRQRHKIRPGRDDDFTIRNLSDIASTAEATSRVMTILLASIASVSLIVGGIGIMNIMLVSVTERTREIGIRMAVGARGRDILMQFLVEAVVLAILGGAIGIALGVSSSKMISNLAGWPVLLSWEAIFTSFFFSGAVGVFFGYYPARRAASLNPIEALRYE